MTHNPTNLDELLPAWEAMYEPGNVSDYLIGYTNSEAAAKGAAIAWVASQTDMDPATLEWVEAPAGYRHDSEYELIQLVDGMVFGTGAVVRHRRAQALRDCPSCEIGSEHDAHCPTPESHNWGCGCPTDAKPADDRRADAWYAQQEAEHAAAEGAGA
ncbi:hypothetical protein ABTX80_24900 [Streptomyces erythrochromogenes]|uniref:hypothetical protein n=1 Tax=Streptomyces erythrochromogenes TaxID=285574 RepID=UPI00332463EE